MQKHFYLGLTLLVVLLALCLGVTFGMQAIHQPGETALQTAAHLALEGKLSQAIPLAQEAYGRWNKYRAVTASCADHGPMDDTESLFQEMLIYGQAGEVPHFSACCAQLSKMLRAMYDAHTLALENFL